MHDAAALATVPCMRPGQKLHVYGFNWNPQAWFMHKMDSEQKIIKRLFRGMDVSIHPTACDGMYTCDKLCDGLFYRIAKDGDKAVCEAKVCIIPVSTSCRVDPVVRHLRTCLEADVSEQTKTPRRIAAVSTEICLATS